MIINLLVAILVALSVVAFDTASAVFSTVHLNPCILAAVMLPSANVKPLLHSVSDVMAVLSCSRTSVYVLVNKRQLDAVKLLGATRITDESLQRLLAAAPAAKIAGNAIAAPPPPRKRVSSRRVAV